MSGGGDFHDPCLRAFSLKKLSCGIGCQRSERFYMSSKPAKFSVKRKKKAPAFDPKAFLSKISDGHTVSNYRKDEIVYTQGQPADSVFYMHKGKAKITVLSERGKEAVVANAPTPPTSRPKGNHAGWASSSSFFQLHSSTPRDPDQRILHWCTR